jgi:hypothetical protein
MISPVDGALHTSRVPVGQVECVIMIPLGAITVAVECEASINEIRENNGRFHAVGRVKI